MKVIFATLLLTASLAFVLLGCSDNSPSIVGPTSQPNVSSALSKVLPNHEGTITLTGLTLFDVYAKEEHRVIISSQYFNLPCSAKLVFTDKQRFVLTTTEWQDQIEGTPFRMVSFAGEMTPSGQLKFTWPETWVQVNSFGETNLAPHSDVIAQMREETGYNLSGPGVNNNTLNYVGFFDGNRFSADFHIVGFYREPGSMGEPYNVVVKGPILVDFGIDLNVSP